MHLVVICADAPICLAAGPARAPQTIIKASFLVGVRALVRTVDRSGATIINPCAKLGVESRELAAQASLSPACQRPPGPWATGSGSFRGLWGFSTYFLTVMQIRNISVSVRFPTHAGPKSLISDRATQDEPIYMLVAPRFDGGHSQDPPSLTAGLDAVPLSVVSGKQPRGTGSKSCSFSKSDQYSVGGAW